MSKADGIFVGVRISMGEWHTNERCQFLGGGLQAAFVTTILGTMQKRNNTIETAEDVNIEFDILWFCVLHACVRAPSWFADTENEGLKY